jgi:hypothetical protein
LNGKIAISPIVSEVLEEGERAELESVGLNDEERTVGRRGVMDVKVLCQIG